MKSTIPEKEASFIEYLLARSRMGDKKLPSIANIAQDLGISTPNIREQIAIARALGLISVQPRTGIRVLPYKFSPSVRKSLYYAVRISRDYFEQFSELRNQIEKAYFMEASSKLLRKDIDALKSIVDKAKKKLDSMPVQIPHDEHKAFHLLIYKRVENIFLNGLLESYWDMYESVGLNTYADLSYLRNVWTYHQEIAQAIAENRLKDAYQFLEDHIELLKDRENQVRSFSDAK